MVTVTSGAAAINMPCKSVEISIAKNLGVRREAGFWSVSGAYAGPFEATVKIDFLADSTNEFLEHVARTFAYSGQDWFALTFDCQQGLFTTDGKRLRVTCPHVLLDTMPDLSPSDGDAQGRTITGSCLNTAAATDNDCVELQFI
jgi:hypothetical protein